VFAAGGVDVDVSHQAVVEYGDSLVAADERLDHTSKLGVDEHTFQHANAHR